eukprot:3530012-Alexandrium_andersonii.AAC.1
MSASLVGSEMCIRDRIRAPQAPHEARRVRRPPLESGAPNCCRPRAAERVVWPDGRAVTASSRVGF